MTIGWVSRLFCLAAIASACSYGSPFSKCDVNHDGSTGIADVQAVVNEALGGATASDDLNSDGAVDVVDVEIDLNAGVGWACVADPDLVSIVPNSGQQGASSLNVTVTGRLISFTGSSTIALGSGVTVSNVAAANATTLTATLAIDANASPGPRDLTVGSLTLPNAFTVTVPSSVSFTYDSQGRLSTASYLSGTGAVTVVTYTYDAAGNRLAVVAK
ncbi:MAG TPA: RHS repeat domain-containing protein [Bryobacteraceae bacterium]|jgi:hypothetical protein|nr:RHS repeat domain-containing protein [Bryobacteraceae bacterium]